MQIARVNLIGVTTIALGLVAGFAVAFDEHVCVVTSDFANSTGNSAAFDVVAPWNSASGLEATGPNTVVRHFFGLHYVGRPQSGDIQVIDPETFDTFLTFSVGAGSVPHDIAVVDGSRAYVSRHASPLLHEVDPATGSLLDTIDLGVLADADGIPEMSMMALDGQRLFVQIQRLDAAGLAVPPSYLAVVDVLTNQLIDVDPRPGVQGIELTGQIPRFKMQIEGRKLYVSEPGLFHDTAGGIDEIDLDRLEALGFITSEAQVPLDISGFILTSPTKGYVLTHTDLRVESRDPATGEMSISYAPGCAAADQTIVFGPLANVGGYGYSGQICGLGNSGTFHGFNPGIGSYFFVVVANDGAVTEGSYGRNSELVERPEDPGDPVCALTRDLARRCD